MRRGFNPYIARFLSWLFSGLLFALPLHQAWCKDTLHTGLAQDGRGSWQLQSFGFENQDTGGLGRFVYQDLYLVSKHQQTPWRQTGILLEGKSVPPVAGEYLIIGFDLSDYQTPINHWWGLGLGLGIGYAIAPYLAIEADVWAAPRMLSSDWDSDIFMGERFRLALISNWRFLRFSVNQYYWDFLNSDIQRLEGMAEQWQAQISIQLPLQ